MSVMHQMVRYHLRKALIYRTLGKGYQQALHLAVLVDKRTSYSLMTYERDIAEAHAMRVEHLIKAHEYLHIIFRGITLNIEGPKE